MSLYQVELVFRYLPMVLTVFTKVNHSHKGQKYVIVPNGVGIIYLPVVLTFFTKVNHSHKVQKYVIIPSGVGIKIPTVGPYSFYKGESQS